MKEKSKKKSKRNSSSTVEECGPATRTRHQQREKAAVATRTRGRTPKNQIVALVPNGKPNEQLNAHVDPKGKPSQSKGATGKSVARSVRTKQSKASAKSAKAVKEKKKASPKKKQGPGANVAKPPTRRKSNRLALKPISTSQGSSHQTAPAAKDPPMKRRQSIRNAQRPKSPEKAVKVQDPSVVGQKEAKAPPMKRRQSLRNAQRPKSPEKAVKVQDPSVVGQKEAKAPPIKRRQSLRNAQRPKSPEKAVKVQDPSVVGQKEAKGPGKSRRSMRGAEKPKIPEKAEKPIRRKEKSVQAKKVKDLEKPARGRKSVNPQNRKTSESTKGAVKTRRRSAPAANENSSKKKQSLNETAASTAKPVQVKGGEPKKEPSNPEEAKQKPSEKSGGGQGNKLDPAEMNVTKPPQKRTGKAEPVRVRNAEIDVIVLDSSSSAKSSSEKKRVGKNSCNNRDVTPPNRIVRRDMNRQHSDSSEHSLNEPTPRMLKNGVLANTYTLLKLLGKGEYAKVVLAKHIVSGAMYAVKAISKGKLDKNGLRRLRHELNMVEAFNHPHIVPTCAVYEDGTYAYVVMDRCEYDLGEYIIRHEKSTGHRFLTDEQSSHYTKQILLGIAYLHLRNITHRDLKYPNVLVGACGRLKIADFGFSRQTTDNLDETFVGSQGFAAPELFRSKPYDAKKVDIWAVGVMAFGFVVGYLPYGIDEQATVKANGVPWCERIGEEAYNFLLDALQKCPEDRPAAEDLLHMPWIAAASGFDDVQARRERPMPTSAQMPRSLSDMPSTDQALKGSATERNLSLSDNSNGCSSTKFAMPADNCLNK